MHKPLRNDFPPLASVHQRSIIQHPEFRIIHNVHIGFSQQSDKLEFGDLKAPLCKGGCQRS